MRSPKGWIRVFLVTVMMSVALWSAAMQAQQRKLGTIGPPPRRNPQRQTSAEGVPPLPLPATPLRRSEPKAEPAPPLFVGKRGTMTSRGLQQAWKAAVRRAGLPDELSIHSARHTLAVVLLRKTGNLRLVQKQLGHSSPTTTANMYADVSFADMQDAVDGLYDDKS